MHARRLLPIRSCPSSRSTFAKNDEPRRKKFSGPCENGQTVPPVSLKRVFDALSLPSLGGFADAAPARVARAVQDLVASLASGGPSQTVPQVRINECLLALARAKVVVKAVVKVRPPPGRFFLVCRSVEA
mgnify:CR=1 FL=1|jgi:hypothetical protein